MTGFVTAVKAFLDEHRGQTFDTRGLAKAPRYGGKHAYVGLRLAVLAHRGTFNGYVEITGHGRETVYTWGRPGGAVVECPTTQASAGEKSGGRP
jgi:hypothetical protein